jgi:hypothetical protein
MQKRAYPTLSPLVLLILILLLSVLVSAEIPGQKTVPWSDYFNKAPERLFIGDMNRFTLSTTSNYELVLGNSSYYFKLNSIAASSTNLHFYNINKDIFLFQDELETQMFLEDEVTMRLEKVTGNVAIISLALIVPPPVVKPVVDTTTSPAVSSPISPSIDRPSPVIPLTDSSSNNNANISSSSASKGFKNYFILVLCVLIGSVVGFTAFFILHKRNSKPRTAAPPVIPSIPITSTSSIFQDAIPSVNSNDSSLSQSPNSASLSSPASASNPDIDKPIPELSSIFSFDEYEKLKTHLEKTTSHIKL